MAPGIWPRTPLRSTPVKAFSAGGSWLISFVTSVVVWSAPPKRTISSIWKDKLTKLNFLVYTIHLKKTIFWENTVKLKNTNYCIQERLERNNAYVDSFNSKFHWKFSTCYVSEVAQYYLILLFKYTTEKLLKGQLISKCLFGIFNSSKKRTEKFDLQYYVWYPNRCVFFCFLGELKTSKSWN